MMCEEITSLCKERLYYILTDSRHDKFSRDKSISDLELETLELLEEKYERSEMRQFYASLVKKTLRCFSLIAFIILVFF